MGRAKIPDQTFGEKKASSGGKNAKTFAANILKLACIEIALNFKLDQQLGLSGVNEASLKIPVFWKVAYTFPFPIVSPDCRDSGFQPKTHKDVTMQF